MQAALARVRAGRWLDSPFGAADAAPRVPQLDAERLQATKLLEAEKATSARLEAELKVR